MTDERPPPVNPNPRPSGVSGVAPPVEYQFRPGNKSNGGRPPGASVLSAMLRDLAKNPDEDGIGAKAREVAQALIEVSTGLRDPASVDTKAALAILDRTDGPLIKERHITGDTVKRVVIDRRETKPMEDSP